MADANWLVRSCGHDATVIGDHPDLHEPPKLCPDCVRRQQYREEGLRRWCCNG